MSKRIMWLALIIGLASIFVSLANLAEATRTPIGETQLVMDSYKTPTAATALASEMNITASKDNRLMLVIANTASGAGLNVTILKGSYFRAGLGNLTLTIPKASTRLVGPLESSRFEQADGKIYAVCNATAGTITGYRLPSS